jgi:hypothetical protein
MGGRTDLDELLRLMQPAMRPDLYIFCTVPEGSEIPSGISPLMTFREAEGVTLIVEVSQADRAGLPGTFPCRLITLNVHSSLDAVGFLAAITNALADAGIGVNPVSGYFHDHLFVPAERAEEAMAVLVKLARRADGQTGID